MRTPSFSVKSDSEDNEIAPGALGGGKMRNARFFAITGVVLVVFAVIVIGVTRQRFRSAPSTELANPDQGQELTNSALFSHRQLIAFNRWSTQRNGNPNLSYVIRTSAERDCPGSGVKLSILDESAATIYEDTFCWIDAIYPQNILRNGRPQLVIAANLGGNETFLKILDYQSGKVVDLTAEIESDYGSHAEVRPQFRGGVHPAVEPFELLLTGPGLASTGEKFTAVFRVKDGKYQFVGEFSATKADNLVEQLMSSSRNKTK